MSFAIDDEIGRKENLPNFIKTIEDDLLESKPIPKNLFIQLSLDDSE